MRRLACLDGLRGVLAAYVLLSHMAPFAVVPAWIAHPFSHGEAAVDVFFILSGMVIAGSLESFRGKARPFLLARAARLLPVFFVVFPIAVAIQPLPRGFDRMPWIGPDSTARSIWSEDWPMSWAPEIAAHVTMTHGLFPTLVLPNAWVSFLGAAWSLSTEWQFYALMAALAAGWLWHDQHLRLSTATALMLTLALAAVAWDTWASPEWQFSRAFLPNKAHYFALGLAAARLRRESTAAAVRFYAATLLAVSLLCLAWGGPDKLAAPLVWTACLSAQLAPGITRTAPLARLLRSPLLLWLGAVSYPVYLVNEPIQKLFGVALSAIFPGHAGAFTALWLPGAVLLPLAAAWVLHRFIELPCQLRSYLLAPRPAAVPQAPSPI